jgi:hypothetical protein
VESVAVVNHDAGSASVAGHTFARTVVGEIPLTCIRTRNAIPGA